MPIVLVVFVAIDNELTDNINVFLFVLDHFTFIMTLRTGIFRCLTAPLLMLLSTVKIIIILATISHFLVFKLKIFV